MYDVCIVGAGPAGATLARLLAGRCRVLLLDSGRTKCCGGILAPEAQKMLVRLELEIPEHVCVTPQPRSVAVLDLQSHIVRHYARNYINVDRQAFDQWLLSMVPNSVDVRHRAVFRSSSVASDGKSIDVRFAQDGQVQVCPVRQLVGADGAFSMVRRENFSSANDPKRYLAIQHWFDKESFVREQARHHANICFQENYVGIFESEITDFYAWFIPKQDHIILGAAIPMRNNAKEKFAHLVAKIQKLGISLSQPVRRESGQLLRPIRFGSMNLGNDRVFLVGEAAGLISPSSAEGIGAALCSAWQLSQAFDKTGLNANQYHRRLQALRWNIWLKNIKNPVMFSPRLRKWIMLSGLTAQKNTK